MEINRALLPYINNLSLEADVPLEYAKAVFGIVSMFTSLIRMAFVGSAKEKGDAELRRNMVSLMGGSLVAIIVQIGELAGVSEAKAEATMNLALGLTEQALRDNNVPGVNLDTGEFHGNF